jgi:hypothetical protein
MDKVLVEIRIRGSVPRNYRGSRYDYGSVSVFGSYSFLAYYLTHHRRCIYMWSSLNGNKLFGGQTTVEIKQFLRIQRNFYQQKSVFYGVLAWKAVLRICGILVRIRTSD